MKSSRKSTLVKQILKGLGVTILEKRNTNTAYKDKLVKITTWSEADLKPFEDAGKSFNSLM